MGIKSQIPMNEVENIIRNKIEIAEKVIIEKLSYVGESCVNNARSEGNYIDLTGNLRSSIGYVIVKNGNAVRENIKESTKGSDKKKGLSQAKQFIKELASKYDKGIVLIVVAGMNYATHVESRRNVLASAQLLAERETPRMMKELGFIKSI